MDAVRPLVDATHPVWTSPSFQTAVEQQKPGSVIRQIRQAAHLTQGQAGDLCGYSTSTMSRIENGRPPIDQIEVRRHLAQVMSIPHEFLGLTAPTQRHERHPGHGSPRDPARPATVPTGGGDPMKRRTLLTSAGAATAAIAGLSSANPATAAPAQACLEQLLLAQSMPVDPLPISRASADLAAATRAYKDARYADLAHALPRLLARLHASRTATTGHPQESLAGMLARAYGIASSLATKYGDDAIALTMADRGLTAARESGDGLTITAAVHVLAITMRRDGHHTGALNLLTSTAANLGADRSDATPQLIGAYGSLLCTAAYTSAQAGNTGDADTYITEATSTADRLGNIVTPGVIPFSASGVNIYKIGVYTTLGDTGRALTHAAAVEPDQLPTAERYGRYLVDTARAWNRHGRPDKAAHALLAADSHAPEEVNRSSVRELVAALIIAPTATPAALRELAIRIGVH
ncbi:helix-turn-helix transcriptional regulator [Actinoplanes sp. TBRC 11911]|uniref:helix-turn-helix domain-containing protein n=1 Tax=Actinoplanes sp. TBRC 11911 TaxID=2729386 RepID=UPI00145E8313|nr:helix-turn-helix transcriptional regulator [Actinoplanes sp. TBRC 11911]NMO50692.1 helix-turn-helix transcriptional regulator [Actinoplanes sp. TBRC 11911]